MQLELTLRRFAQNNACFVIPTLFLKKKYIDYFEDKIYLEIGKKYKLTIEEVTEKNGI